MPAGRWIAAVAGLAAAMSVAGCVSLVREITQPRTHNAIAGDAARMESQHFGMSRLTVAARNGNRITYTMLAPADYHLEFNFQRDLEAHRLQVNMEWDGEPTPVPRAGTIVYLHGWGDDHSTMMLWATALARHGYEGVLPDLRNFGASDRAPVGFGPREADDIVDLLKALQSRPLQRPVYLFGVSYGADVAINAAAQAPGLIDDVVAMEPFVDAASAIRGFVAETKSPYSSINGRAFAFYARHAFDDARVERAITESGERLGLDLGETGIRAPLRDNKVCTLLLQGSRDEFLDASALRKLRDAPHVRYLELAGESHLSLPVRIDLLADPLADWLRDASHCPPAPGLSAQ
jgi:pimeloyl-ACP methyl ester carboxylesterase